MTTLLNFAKEANLEEVFWEKGRRQISFLRRRRTALPAMVPVPGISAAKNAAPEPLQHHIFSPMVGTFLRAPRNRPPLVVEGGQVTVGQKVGLVEAMNVPKDVVSTLNGRIVKILLENGKPTEYGQKLFEVEV